MKDGVGWYKKMMVGLKVKPKVYPD